MPALAQTAATTSYPSTHPARVRTQVTVDVPLTKTIREGRSALWTTSQRSPATITTSQAPALRVLPRLERAPAPHDSASPGGLIVVTGPPLCGKRTLGHYLHEFLPRSVHLTLPDPALVELRGESPRELEEVTRRLRTELCQGMRVVLSARLAEPTARERVLRVARRLSVPTLIVEVEGTDAAALERATELANTLGDLRKVLAKLCELLPSTRRSPRQARVPTVVVPAEAPVEDQVKAVLDGWGKLGAVD